LKTRTSNPTINFVRSLDPLNATNEFVTAPGSLVPRPKLPRFSWLRSEDVENINYNIITTGQSNQLFRFTLDFINLLYISINRTKVNKTKVKFYSQSIYIQSAQKLYFVRINIYNYRLQAGMESAADRTTLVFT
jgi:hypothetical protein